MRPPARRLRFARMMAAARCGIALLLCAATPLPAQEEVSPEEEIARDTAIPAIDRSALEPDKRIEEVVEEGERNPFGLVSGQTSEGPAPVAETEEQKLRRVLGSMRIAGVTGTPGSYRVLLGSMVLSEGDLLPRLFSDQAEILRVQSIGEREVTLSFVEKDTAQPARTIGLSIDLKPRINSMMAGEAFSKLVPFGANGEPSVPPLPVPAVQSYMDGAQASQLQSLVDRPLDMMGDATPKRPDEKPADQDIESP